MAPLHNCEFNSIYCYRFDLPGVTAAPGTYTIVPQPQAPLLPVRGHYGRRHLDRLADGGDNYRIRRRRFDIDPNQTVTLTAQVASVTSGTPTGSVTFLDNGTPLQTVPISSGAASLTTALGQGMSYCIVVPYSGDCNFLSSAFVAAGNGATGISVAIRGAGEGGREERDVGNSSLTA
jgi:hypothetical protein